MIEQAQFAPIAEYKGIALIEKEGDVKSSWKGTTYFTDGNIHLWVKSKGLLQIEPSEGYSPETNAKEAIDNMQEEELINFLNYVEAFKALDATPIQLAAAEERIKTIEFVFDEEQGVFIAQNRIRLDWLLP